MFKYGKYKNLLRADKQALAVYACEQMGIDTDADNDDDEVVNWLWQNTEWEEVSPFTYDVKHGDHVICEVHTTI